MRSHSSVRLRADARFEKLNSSFIYKRLYSACGEKSRIQRMGIELDAAAHLLSPHSFVGLFIMHKTDP